MCAGMVRESPTFFAREMAAFFARELARVAGVNRVDVYSLRGNGVRVALRHAAKDSSTLAEVFHVRNYEPSEEIAKAIGHPRAIVDLGANIGLFGVFAASFWPRSTIVGYEADPANAAVHERTIAANGLGDRCRVVCCAAGSRDGEVELAAGRAMESFVVEPGSDPSVPTIRVPMRDVVPEVCGADLVKIDIEGGEWEIVTDPRFQRNPPRALVIEYHPHLCPSADPRAAAEQALADAHLTTASIGHRDDGYGMMWAWR